MLFCIVCGEKFQDGKSLAHHLRVAHLIRKGEGEIDAE